MRVLHFPEDRAIGGAEARADEIARSAERVLQAAEELVLQVLRGDLRRPLPSRPGPHRRPAPPR